jgi:phospholipid/cholesterol/gamma-HCH transport system substrate-binding protein
VGAGILLAFMAVFFGGAPRLFQSRNKYTIVFKDAPGVVRGTPVRRSGVRIGEVESILLDDEKSVVRVYISVDKNYTIRDNEEPIIVPDLLSRDTTIDFIPKEIPKPIKPQAMRPDIEQTQFAQAQPEPGMGPVIILDTPRPGNPVPPGSEIHGRPPSDPLGALTGIVPSAERSLNQIRRSVERFEKIAPVLEATLQEYAELGRALREVVPEVRRTNDELRTDLRKLRELEPDVRRLLGEVEGLARQFSRVGERVDVFLQTNADQLDQIVRNSRDVTQRLAALLNDENQRNFSATLKNMQTLTKNLDELALQAKTQTLPRFQDTMTKFDSVLVNANQLLAPLAARSEAITRNLDLALENTAKFVGGFSDAFGVNGRQDGSIQRLFSDPALFNNLNDASLMLVRILPRLDRAMKDIEAFADKIARHPELLGVGGAVKPSAGLKDPPGVPYRSDKPKQP